MLCLVGSLGSTCGMDGEKRFQDMAASSFRLRMGLFLWMDGGHASRDAGGWAGWRMGLFLSAPNSFHQCWIGGLDCVGVLFE